MLGGWFLGIVGGLGLEGRGLGFPRFVEPLVALCGVSPLPASSGKTNRHLLNRGGNRQANAILDCVVVANASIAPVVVAVLRIIEGSLKASAGQRHWY